MINRKEVDLVREIILENSLPEKVLKDDLRKLFIRKGLSTSSANNYLYTLIALEVVKEETPFLIFEKKFYEGATK